MPYKLVLELNVIARKFKSLLKENEVPRGIPAVFEIYATNIGNDATPVGITSKFMFESRNYVTTFPDLPIAKLEPNKRTFLHRITFSPYEEGVTWVVISLKPVNNEPFSYFDFVGGMERKEEWRRLFYVVNREMLTLILWLKRLNRATK